MPVRKFRRVEDMTPPPARQPGPSLDRAIDFVLNTAASMTPLRFPPGIYRHRSIEEMDALQDQWRRSALRR